MFELLSASFLCILVIYGCFFKVITKRLIISSLLMLIYLALVFSTNMPIYSRIGGLYGFVPTISFGAIVLPELNPNSPTVVTVSLGFLGLLVTILSLLYFKFFVW